MIKKTTPQLPIEALVIDHKSKTSLNRQVYDYLAGLIMRGVLVSGSELPSTRALAREVGVSRNTLIAAYEQLAAAGLVETRPGARAHVAERIPEAPDGANGAGGRQSLQLSRMGASMRNVRALSSFTRTAGLRPGYPDVRLFPFKTWNRLMARHYRATNGDLFTYSHTVGYPPLRASIARYVHAYRGIKCEPDQIIVTTGAQAGLDLIARLLLNVGDAVWMEEPGYVGAQGAFLAAGARLVPLHVDESGWHLDDAPHHDIRLIYTSPSSQHPLGKIMDRHQRARLISIARSNNALIVEDDFDSEFRMVDRSIETIASQDERSQTIYVGTFGKTLFPTIRIGFIVFPEAVPFEVKQAMFVTSHFVGLPMQAALCEFIEGGHLGRHIRKMRELYSVRKKLLIELLSVYLGKWCSIVETDICVQVACIFKVEIDDVDVAYIANERSINVSPLSVNYLGEQKVSGLVLGCAALNEMEMRSCVHGLSDILSEM